ncbi:MAG: MerR family transcriptional regulator [Polyangiaceae bacterium]
MSAAARGFPIQLAAELTGVTPRTLVNWCARDFVEPSVSRGRTGPGGERLYSFRDLVAIRVADDLRSRGMDVRNLRPAVDYIRSRDGLELDGVVSIDVFLLSDGRTFREVPFGPTFGELVRGAMQFKPRGPYSMLFIPFGKFVHELQTKVRAQGALRRVPPEPLPSKQPSNRR